MSLVLCQRDAYMKRVQTRVVSLSSRAKQTWIELEETILYPEGGGQPADFGTIEGLPVRDVQRVEGRVLHSVALRADRVPLEVGQEVEVCVDWGRRFDHMQQHTAQHLITAIAHDHFGVLTTSFHLGQETCAIELDTEALSEAQRLDLEDRVNRAVRAALPVVHRVVDVEAFSALEHVRSRGLPAGFSGPVRLVEIEGVDLNTCGGTHVSSTAELTTVLLTHTERARRQTRLYYVAGDRVRARFHASFARERALGNALSCSPDELPKAVERLQDSLQSATQEARRTRRALNQAIAERLTQSPDAFVAHYVPDVDVAALGDIAKRILQAPSKRVVLLTTGSNPQGAGLFLLLGPDDVVPVLGPAVAEALGGRGGGRQGRYQGRVARLQDLAQAVDVIRDVVSGA